MSKVSQQSSAGRLFAAILITVLLVLGIVFFLYKDRILNSSAGASAGQTEQPSAPGTTTDDSGSAQADRGDSPTPGTTSPRSGEENRFSGFTTPEALVQGIQEAITQGSLPELLEKIDLGLLEEGQRGVLIDFGELNVGQELASRNVGVLEFDKKNRWAIRGGNGAELHLDVTKAESGGWKLSSASVPTTDSTAQANQDADALATADIFIKNLLSQNFEEALRFVDKTTISDVQIAGLCIMFEEGKYQLNAEKPLNSLFLREGLAAFTVNLLESQDLSKGQLELALQRSEGGPWKVSELNMQKLLKSYIDRVSGGDSYYTPIIKNPQGGDRLALFFEFNDDELTPRAKSQLDIIASLIKSSAAKKLTLSGHADAIGSDGYNESLSLERAKSVQNYLISKGLKRNQIELSAYGESKPRSDNETDQGRRANRRTEILLDF